jgi:SAM-dependent methyltransferase
MTGGAPETPGRAAPPSDHWDQAAAAWDRWFDTIEAGAKPVGERLVALAGLGPGLRVLDLGTGVGEPAATAARRVVPGGSVLATDVAPAMLDLARARARRLGLDNIEFRRMDMAAIDLPEAGFDAVLCRWGLMFAPDVDRTLTRIRRLLKPGGRLALAVWGPPERVPMIGLPTEILNERLDLPPLPEGTPTAFSLSDVDALERRLQAAGFGDVAREPVTVTLRFDSPETYVQFRREVSNAEARAAHCPPERREDAWRAVADAAAAFAVPDGEIVIPNLAYCLSGTR